MATNAESQMKLDSPALAPPPGIRPNFVNPENLQAVINAIGPLCLSISTFIFWMRMYTKLFIFRKTGWEDYTFLMAWLMHIGFCVPSIWGLQKNSGAHQWNVRLRDLTTLLHRVYFATIIYGIAIAFVKLSLLLQYLKIFVPIRNYSSMVLLTYFVIWSNLIFYIITTFLWIFPCKQQETYWNPLISNRRCINLDATTISSATINCFSDFVILLLPQGVIWTLQMPLRRKLGISAIFLTGFLACIVSAIRIYYCVRIHQTRDRSYNIAILGLWSHVEIALGIMCGCLPVLPRLFSALRPKIPMLWKSCVQIRALSQWIKPSRFSGNTVKDHPNEVQPERPSGEMHGLDLTVRKDSTATNSAASDKVQLIAPSEGDPTTDQDSVGVGSNTNQILRTVHIHTTHESCHDLDLDIEAQSSTRT